MCVAPREMATTFARLCQQVDQTQRELEAEIRRLTAKIEQLETVLSHSKNLRSVRPCPAFAGLFFLGPQHECCANFLRIHIHM